MVISDLAYDETSKDWTYSTIPVEDITDLSDLDNCIMNLNKVGDNVQFERYHAPSDNSEPVPSSSSISLGNAMAFPFLILKEKDIW